MRMLIVGAGTMGEWFGTLASEWVSVEITDIDHTRAKAVADSIGVSARQQPIDSAVDIVVTAVPIPATVPVIEEYGQLANSAIIDVSGTMAEPIEAMRSVGPACELLCLHPLFSPDNAPGNIPMVVEHDGRIAEQLTELLEAAGNTCFQTTATEHDAAMRTVQSKAHSAILAYALSAEPVDDKFQTPISSQLNDLASSILSGESRVYADIQSYFSGRESSAGSADILAQADYREFQELFEAMALEWNTDETD